jgi:hypothetical protein
MSDDDIIDGHVCVSMKKGKHGEEQDTEEKSSDDSDDNSDDDEDKNEGRENKSKIALITSKKNNNDIKGEGKSNSNNSSINSDDGDDGHGRLVLKSGPKGTPSDIFQSKRSDVCDGMDLESEGQDPFDFSASLAKGRALDSVERKTKRKKRNCDEGEEEEEEEEEEMEMEEKEEKVEEEVEKKKEVEEEEKVVEKEEVKKDFTDKAALSKLRKRKKKADVRNMVLRTKKKRLNEGSSKTTQSHDKNFDINREDVEEEEVGDVEAEGDVEVEEEMYTADRQPHRCLIFAQHRQTLDIIEKCVLKLHFPSVCYRRLDGTVPPIVRAEIARQFNAQEEYGKSEKHDDEDKGQTVNQNVDENDSGIEEIEDNEENIVHHERAKEKATNGLKNIKASKEPSRRKEALKESKSVISDIRILLMTTRSCGLGLNLVAADTVIL